MITLKYIEISNHCGNHIEICRNEPLCCVTGANIVLQVNYTTIANKQTDRQRDHICGYHSQLWGRVSWIR